MNCQEERGNVLRPNARGQHAVRCRAQSTNVERSLFFTGGGGRHAVHTPSLQRLHGVAAHQEQIETNTAETLLRHLRQGGCQRVAAEDLTVTLQSLTHLSGSHLQSSGRVSGGGNRDSNSRLSRSHNGCRNSGCNRLNNRSRGSNRRSRRNLSGSLGNSRHRRTSRTRQQCRRSTRHRSQRLTQSALTSCQTSLTLRRARLLSSLKSLLTSLQLSRNILRQLVLE